MNPETKRKELLEFIRQNCIENNITQDQISERTGFTQSNISRMLAGKFPPTLDNFIKLTGAVNCEIIIKKQKNRK